MFSCYRGEKKMLLYNWNTIVYWQWQHSMNANGKVCGCTWRAAFIMAQIMACHTFMWCIIEVYHKNKKACDWYFHSGLQQITAVTLNNTNRAHVLHIVRKFNGHIVTDVRRSMEKTIWPINSLRSWRNTFIFFHSILVASVMSCWFQMWLVSAAKTWTDWLSCCSINICSQSKQCFFSRVPCFHVIEHQLYSLFL